MLKTRVIPCLLMIENALVKTIRFDKYNYIGAPINTIRIFNEYEVDELILLDIRATVNNQKPDFNTLQEIVNECFIPLTYGGGIRSVEDVRKILNIGFEKVAINTYLFEKPEFLSEVAVTFGSQCVVASIDVKKNFWGKYEVYSHSGMKNTHLNPVEWAEKMAKLGAGELLLNSIDKDGTWEGLDEKLVKVVHDAVSIPVIACGGAGKLEHIKSVVENTGVSAVAAGSLFVYQKKDHGVLVNYPSREILDRILP